MVPLKDSLKRRVTNMVPIHLLVCWGEVTESTSITPLKKQGEIIVSSGQIGRSVKVNAEAVCKLVHGKFTDLLEQEE